MTRLKPVAAESLIVDIPEASVLAGLPEKVFRAWRTRGLGPHSFKLGDRTVYLRTEFMEWLEQREQ